MGGILTRKPTKKERTQHFRIKYDMLEVIKAFSDFVPIDDIVEKLSENTNKYAITYLNEFVEEGILKRTRDKNNNDQYELVKGKELFNYENVSIFEHHYEIIENEKNELSARMIFNYPFGLKMSLEVPTVFHKPKETELGLVNRIYNLLKDLNNTADLIYSVHIKAHNHELNVKEINLKSNITSFILSSILMYRRECRKRDDYADIVEQSMNRINDEQLIISLAMVKGHLQDDKKALKVRLERDIKPYLVENISL